MSDLDALYQELILEHNRRPKNYRVMEDADRKVEGHNPLCGDQLTLWVKLDGDQLKDVSFQGSGCAISKASASLMTAAVKGKTRAEAEELFTRFRALVTGALDAESEALFRDALEQLKEGRTTIVIAHRLSTVHQSDNIIVMEAGEVVEQGPHAALLERRDGGYRRLYDFQLLP